MLLAWEETTRIRKTGPRRSGRRQVLTCASPIHRTGLAAAALILVVAACGGPADPPASTRPGPEPTYPTPAVVVSPEFVQGAIPGAEVMLLVSLTDEAFGEARVTATAPGATVSVEPSAISGGQVAEVTVVPQPVTNETDLTITIEVVADALSRTITRNATVFPWEDDRGEQAKEILDLFTSWLAENRPDLGVTPQTEFEGTFLAPQLLVVSHYGFFNDHWEIGVSWHVMIPPDDFAEIYLRGRSDLRPSVAFRIGSWQTALDTGDYDVLEVQAPPEVVR